MITLDKNLFLSEQVVNLHYTRPLIIASKNHIFPFVIKKF